MQGDFTRWTFDPGQGYRSVLLQQGRVLLDADFNEQTEITAHHDEARTRDVVGLGGGPSEGAGFSIVDASGAPPAGTAWADLRITPGSYYVDGILCEAASPSAGEGAVPPGWPLADQPYLSAIGDDPGLPEPEEDGRYAVYLDAWTHHVTADEEPSLREPALGGPDTTTRARTVWQARIAPIRAEQRCSGLQTLAAVPRQAGMMVASLQEQAPDADPCQITVSGGYQRLENQLYRVQIHDASGAVPTFVWSRENASVVSALTAIEPSRTAGQDADLLVDRVGRDDELSISLGDAVEVTSTDLELRGLPGFLATAGAPDGLRLPVTWTAGFPASLASLGRSPIVRRWEAPPSDAVAGPADLEGGIQVGFPGGGGYTTGDYWLIPARAVRLAYGLAALPGTIEWPVDAGGAPLPQPPQGPVHHLTPLAILVRAPSTSGHAWFLESDCRKLFPRLTEQVVMDMRGGDGQEARPGQPLPAPIRVGVRNGGLPLAGAAVRFTADAGGHLAVGSAPTSASPETLDATTDASGVIEVQWMLDQGSSARQPPSTQLLSVQLLDDHDDPAGPALVVTGRLSVAAEVAWRPDPACTGLAQVTTVAEGLMRLASMRQLRLLGGDGQHLSGAQLVAPQPVRVVVDSPCGPVEGAVVRALDPKQQALVAQAKAAETTPPTLEGTGAVSEARARTGEDGVAAFFWQPDFTGGPSQTLSIFLGEGTGAPIVVTAQRVAGPAGPDGPQVSAVRVGLKGTPLLNGGDTVPGILATGLRAVLRGAGLDPRIAAAQLMHVSLDLPWPTTASEREWADGAVGYRAVELQGTVAVEPEALLWTPTPAARSFILSGLWGVLGRKTPVTGWIAVEEWALAADPASARGRYLQWFLLSPPDVQPLPPVVGRTLAVAARELAAAGLAVAVTEEPHPSVRKGLIISADPAPGTEVLPGTTVTLVVSTGRTS
jgi:hypothetical protein